MEDRVVSLVELARQPLPKCPLASEVSDVSCLSVSLLVLSFGDPRGLPLSADAPALVGGGRGPAAHRG